jgi:hypothetical protein
LPWAVVSSQRSRHLGRAAELRDLSDGLAIIRRAVGVADQDRIGPAAAFFEDIDKPANQPGGAARIIGFDSPFQPVAIGEAARGEGRRQPGQQP